MLQEVRLYAVFLLGMVLLCLIGICFRKPLKFLIRLAFQSVLGGVILILLNTVGAVWGFYIGVNVITAFTVGLLGLPGLLLLIALKIFF